MLRWSNVANKRNQPKPGSVNTRYVPWDKMESEGTFRDMCLRIQQKSQRSNAAKGEHSQTSHSWGKKHKTTMVYAYTGNAGRSNQLPLQKRKANLLEYMKIVPGKIYVKDIEPTVLKALIADGDVYIENGKSGHIRQSHSYAVATDPIEKPVVEEVVKEEPKVVKKTIKWNKEKDQKLLMDVIMGTADQDLVDAVGKTKTKMRKISK